MKQRLFRHDSSGIYLSKSLTVNQPPSAYKQALSWLVYKCHKSYFSSASRRSSDAGAFLYTYTIKPPALRVVPHPALALDNKTSNAIISVGPKPHYI